jgi:hypothetical protein
MSIFLILMIVGLTGMLLMALPGLNRHGHIGVASHGHIGAHGAGTHLPAPTGAIAARAAGAHPAGTAGSASRGATAASNLLRLTQPRVIFTLLALYGAAGYALTGTGLLTAAVAAWVGLIPALLIERYAVTPLWNLLLSFQGKPCSPLESLVLTEAEAVTPFRNGKGIVRVIHDGRAVQMSARLPETQAAMPVRVGDKLRVEEVDTANERITVTLH